MKSLPVLRVCTFVLAVSAGIVHAETPADFLKAFETQARGENPAFQGFSATRGERFFRTVQPDSRLSCASCHTDDPRAEGRHAKTDKRIAPLAPAANAERFSRADKVEKWFRRNCNDVLGRVCSAQEKGDVLAWLMTLKK